MVRFVLFLVVVSLAPRASAQFEEVRARGWLHLNGYSHHFSAPDANGYLLGVGLTVPTGPRWARLTRAWEADVFQDSARKLSAYAGHSWTYRRGRMGWGVTGALMHHRNFHDVNRWSLMPVAFPFAEVPLRQMRLRVYYIPPVRKSSDNQIAFQLLLPLAPRR